MSEDYPLKPTDADLNDESVDAQEPEVVEVYAWQADEPVMAVEVDIPSSALKAMDVAVAQIKEMRFALEAHHANTWENCPVCDSRIGIINRS